MGSWEKRGNAPQVTTPDSAKQAPECLQLTSEHQDMGHEGDTFSPNTSLEVCCQEVVMDSWAKQSRGKGSLLRGQSKLELSAFKDRAFKV